MKVIKPYDVPKDSAFTRASIGSYTDIDGIIKVAAADVPRMNYDIDLAPMLLIEDDSINTLLYSEDLSNASWVKTRTTVTTNSILAPDDNTTADFLEEDTSLDTHFISYTSTVTSGLVYSYSCFLKADQRSSVVVVANDGSVSKASTIDLINGTSSTEDWAATPYINDWYRVSCTFTASVDSSAAYLSIYLHDGASDTYQGIAGYGLYVWGGQQEEAAKTTSYIATSSSTVSRAEDFLGFYTNATESISDWNSGTSYDIGDQVHVPTEHKIYECLVANSNSNPPDNLLGDTPNWYEFSASNPYKPFDKIIGSQVVNTGSIRYVLPSDLISGLAFFNMEEVIRIDINVTTKIEGAVYDKSLDMMYGDDLYIYDWYTYFFNELSVLDSAVVTDLPPYLSGVVTIDFITDSAATDVHIGELVYGYLYDIGSTQYSPQFSIIDYSRKTVDEFGNYSVLQRAFSKRLDTDLIIENNKINTVTKLLESLRATPVVWIGEEDNKDYTEPLVVYGYFKDFSLVIPHPIWAEMSLQIEGLI